MSLKTGEAFVPVQSWPELPRSFRGLLVAGNPVPVLDVQGAPQPGMVQVTDPEAAHREPRELALCAVQVEVEPISAGELEAAGLRVSGAAILGLGELLVE